jgi:hypothetical protein
MGKASVALSLARWAAPGEFYGQAGLLDEMHQVIERMQRNFDTAEPCRVTSWLLELAGHFEAGLCEKIPDWWKHAVRPFFLRTVNTC